MDLKNVLKSNGFRIGLLALAAIISVFLVFTKKSNQNEINSVIPYKNQLIVFVQDGCIHCSHAEEFLNKNKFKDVVVVFHNLKEPKSMNLLFESIERLAIPQENLGTPIFIFNDNYIIGFSQEQENHLTQMIKEKKIK